MTPAGGQLADEDRDMRLKAQMKHAGEPGLEHSEEEHETQLKAAKKAQVAWDVFTAHVWFVGVRSSFSPVSVQFTDEDREMQ